MTEVTFAVEDGSRVFRGKRFAVSTFVDFLDENGMKESTAGNQSSVTTHVGNVRAIRVVADMLDGGFRWFE
jgi:hypothetical protein